jgi:hypothetical protein
MFSPMTSIVAVNTIARLDYKHSWRQTTRDISRDADMLIHYANFLDADFITQHGPYSSGWRHRLYQLRSQVVVDSIANSSRQVFGN